jgi:amino acid adenylation domain-containing protein
MLRIFLHADGVERCTSMRDVICSGEVLPPDLVVRFYAHSAATLHNLYGSTETAIEVTRWTCPRHGDLSVVPIGKPIANTQCYILDQHLQPVPVGVPGELHLGGVQVGRGYHNRPELTEERFIPDPFAGRAGRRLYKTGDLCRYLRDGSIEYLRRIEEHEAFFRQMLGDVDEPTAPFGLLDVQGDGSGIEQAHLAVDPDLARRLRAHARKLGVSAASLFHLAWARVLAKVSGREDVVFGTVLFGHMQGGEGADRVMGSFINTLPIRIRVSEQAVETAVRRTHSLLADLRRHKHASLALAQRCSAVPAPAPLFSALLNYRHSPDGEQALSGEALQVWEGMTRLPEEECTNYPFALSVSDLARGFSLDAQTPASIGPVRVCQFMCTALEALVDALEKQPSKAVRTLDVLPASERHRVLYEWNDTRAEFPSDKCVHQLFEAQVEKTPDATAVVFEEESLTYAELNRRANQLAHHLQYTGVATGDTAAIALERSVDLLIAEIAILKCGAAYIPIDLHYPEERQTFVIQDCGAKVVISADYIKITERLTVPRINIENAPFDKESFDNLAVSANGETTAYVMYTSGSTGQPKGVLVPHKAITRLVLNNGYAKLEPTDRVAFASNPAFDASTLEVWAPLLNGGCIVVISQDTLLEPIQFGEALKRHGVTILWLTVGLFNQYVNTLHKQLANLRYLIIGGDALDRESVAKLLHHKPPQHLLNGYGPTETTTFATTYEIAAIPEYPKGIPIGRPIANTRVYILDAHGEPVPVGVSGELYIAGAGVARGYLNRPELTAEKRVRTCTAPEIWAAGCPTATSSFWDAMTFR